MMRGSILKNGVDFYVLVRAELGDAKDANGQPIVKQARYNLVNLGTGKTRVSEPARMFLQSASVEDVNLTSLRRHFNLPNLEDTGVTMQDVNIPAVVKEAVAAKERARIAIIQQTLVNDPIMTMLARHLAAQQAACARLW